MAQQYYVPAQMARREVQRQQAAKESSNVSAPRRRATRASEMMTPEQTRPCAWSDRRWPS